MPPLTFLASALNPLKTSLLMTLLSLPHSTIDLTFQPRSSLSDLYVNALPSKSSSNIDGNEDPTGRHTTSDPFSRLDPNRKVPFVHDPNTHISMAESNAIGRFLLSTYDKEETWWYAQGRERWEMEMWLDFQVSQQGMVFQQVRS